MIENCITKYSISPSFYNRYFKHNAENRFAASMLEFMLWRRGKFLHPKDREKHINTFIDEETENFYQKDEFNLPQIQFVLTTRCTLKCRDCNFFVPYFNKKTPSPDLTNKDFKKEFYNLTGIINTVRRFMVLGGEPLLSRELPAIAEEVCRSDKVPILEIVTNGTKIPSDDLLDILKKYSEKVYFHISNYSVNESLRPYLCHDKLLALLKDNGIKYQMSTDMHWYREEPFNEHDYSIEQLKAMFSDCWAKRVIQVLNGKIAVCPRTSGGYEMGVVPLHKGQYIDLRASSGEALKKQFIDFYHRDYLDGCRYCTRSEEEVTPARQL
jgi:MoaA/NifB/PqqE/SkfB family radical SAM enzyme